MQVSAHGLIRPQAAARSVSDMNPSPLLTADGLVHAYDSVAVLAGVDLVVPAATSLALMGPSGSGKSTLLHALAGIVVPDGGRVTYATPAGDIDVGALGQEARTRLRRTEFGLVFQSGQLLDELTARENVALPLLVDGLPRRTAMSRADEALTRLGLGGLGRRHPGQLSGGERQRVAVARAIVTGPRVCFADEPTGSLDHVTAHEVMSVMTEVCRAAGAALVLVTHDPSIARRCDRTFHILDGRLLPAATDQGSSGSGHAA